jgi:uncharacterized membrane protein YkvI
MNANRLLAIAGIIFAIAVVVGLFLAGAIDSSESDADILKDTNDSGTQTFIIIGAYSMAIASAMLLCFAARMRSFLGAAEGGRETLARLAQMGATVCAALIAAGGLVIAAISGAVVFGSSPDVTNADVARFIPQIGFGIVLVGGMFSAIVMILSNSILILRTRALPTWYGWLGVVASVALLAGALFIPAVGLAIWALIGGIVMLGKTEDTAAAA